MTANSSPSDDVFALIEREQGRYLAELKEYLRIPSISTDPAYRQDVDRCADWLMAKMQAAGLTTEKIATAGHPLVYAEWLGAGADKPTVLFYGHYDVQPPDPLDEWRNPPFEPTEEGDLPGRPRHDRRQGTVVHPRQGGRGDARRARQAAGERQVHRRRRRGGGRRGDREVRARRRRQRSSPATRWWSPTPRSGRPAFRRSPTA